MMRMCSAGVLFRTVVMVLYFSMVCHWIHANSTTRTPGCKLNWLHPPKTGSVFCLSVQHACNEPLFLQHAAASTGYRTWRGCAVLEPEGTFYSNTHHYGMQQKHIESRDSNELRMYITMLRDPLQRSISAYCDGMHHEGLSDQGRERLYAHMGFSAAPKAPYHTTNASQCVENYLRYARYRPNHGCYVKMLNGHECSAEGVRLSRAMRDVAMLNLVRFLFVGIVEQYEDAVELFMHKVSSLPRAIAEDALAALPIKEQEGDAAAPPSSVISEETQSPRQLQFQPPHAVEMQRVRAGSHPCLPILKAAAARGELQGSLRSGGHGPAVGLDEHDEYLYAFAKRKFLQQLEMMHRAKVAANVTAGGSAGGGGA